jgi:hypothetical protein
MARWVVALLMLPVLSGLFRCLTRSLVVDEVLCCTAYNVSHKSMASKRIMGFLSFVAR